MGGMENDDGLKAVRATLAAVEDVEELGPEHVPAPSPDPEVGGGDGGGVMPPDAAPHADFPDGPGAGGDDGGGSGEDVPAAWRCARLPLNDLGNGERFCVHFGDGLIAVPRVGWFVWDGRVWAKDDDGLRVRRLAQRISVLMLDEITHLALDDWQVEALASEPRLRAELRELTDVPEAERSDEQVLRIAKLGSKLTEIGKLKTRLSDMRAEHRRFARSTGNSTRIDAIVKEAAVQLAREVDALDADPLAVNTESGVLRFRVDRRPGQSSVARMDLIPHFDLEGGTPTRDLLMTKMMPIAFDPQAECPLFAAFLERVQPAAEMRRFLQRWFGLSLTALTGDQKLAFFYGHGANGKSVLVDLMAGLLGGYAATAKIESLTGSSRRGGSDATPDLIPLMGARFVRASEPEQGERMKEGTIKELTGGEPILVRALHSDFVEVKPQFKLTISGNHKPEIRGTDDGIWRRVLLIPFDVQIPPEERDPDLGAKLLREGPGILNWMVAGLIDYLQGGLQVPEAVLDATSEYRADSDPVGTFLTECTVMDGGDAFMLSRDLIAAFNFWLEEKGENTWGGRTVSNALKNHSNRWRHPATGKTYIPGKQTATGYRGVRLTDTFAGRFDAREQGQGKYRGGPTGPTSGGNLPIDMDDY